MARKIAFPKVKLARLTRIIDDDGKEKTEVQYISATEAVVEALMHHGGQGHPITELRERWKLADKLEASKNGAIYLEDEDWKGVWEKVKPYPWPWTAKEVGDICDAIENAETVKIEDVPGLNRDGKRKAKEVPK